MQDTGAEQLLLGAAKQQNPPENKHVLAHVFVDCKIQSSVVCWVHNQHRSQLARASRKGRRESSPKIGHRVKFPIFHPAIFDSPLCGYNKLRRLSLVEINTNSNVMKQNEPLCFIYLNEIFWQTKVVEGFH